MIATEMRYVPYDDVILGPIRLPDAAGRGGK